MRSKMMQVGGAAALMLGGMVLAAALTSAETPTVESPLKFTATTENIADAHDSIEIDLTRFSTDAESSQVSAALTQFLASAAAAGAGGVRAAGGVAGKVQVVEPGYAGRSLMVEKINDKTGNQMPPRGPLSKDDIETIMAWIDNGATEADFGTVQPIFNANCISCHSGSTPKAGLGLDTLEGVMKGGNDLKAAVGGRNRPQTPEGSLAAAMEKAPTLGYVWSSEPFGYAVRYAVKVPQHDGSEHVVLIVDRLDSENDFWKTVGPSAQAKDAATGAAAAGNSEFSVIELRLNSQGHGEGKVSSAGKAAVDGTSKAITLGNYSALPVVLTNVARRTSESATSK